jgi:translation initiation factor 2B subunit (eIF-2B alpha/beta/delta family)
MKMSNNNENDINDLEYWRPEVEKIDEDADHGSLHLADKALSIVQEFVERQLYRNRTELLQSLAKLTNALVRAKSLMALIHYRTHRLLDFIQSIEKEERDINKIKQLTLDEIKAIHKETQDKYKVMTRLGARLIMDQHIVLTHSSGSIIESILLEAHRHKKKFRLICTESRPRFEGAELARRMAKAGIKTKLIPDADITRALHDANFAITGIDRITENSIINKTGTAAIAIISNELNKPFYVVGETTKILLKRTYPARFSSTHETEIQTKSAKNLTVQNIYFEEIPLSYVKKIVCEEGIFETEDFMERFL